VKRISTIRRLLAILMIAGLALSPLSRPVMAEMSSDVAMQGMAQDNVDEMSASALTDEMAAMAADMPNDMANDMPCCPSKAPVPDGCDKCVFMAGCVSTCVTGIPASVVLLPTASNDIIPLKNDSWPDGLGHPPPEHPPRIPV
jgi:hypothetical protein